MPPAEEAWHWSPPLSIMPAPHCLLLLLLLLLLQCEEVQFVDVREQHEFSIARLPHFKLLPLSTSSEWAPTIQQTLDPAAETVVLCHHGMRSMNAAMVSARLGNMMMKRA